MRYLFLLVISLLSTLASAEEAPLPANKQHVLYLLQKGEVEAAIDAYTKHKETLGRHDFEILQDMSLIWINQGMRSPLPEMQLLSLFGAHLAGISASYDVLEKGIQSSFAQTQLAAIYFLGSLQDDRSEALLTRAMASDYLFTRMAAAEQLALRKAKSAVGQIEALMYRIPPQARFFFPPFFAVIGSLDAMRVLKHLMDEPFYMTRIETILSIARLGRDDLLSKVRAAATHSSPAEQEACATALGTLKDSKSIPLLKTLSHSSYETVQIAALRSLYLLGDLQAKEQLITLAENNNLFAITTLALFPEGIDSLKHLIFSPNIQVRINAVAALLEHRSPLVALALKEFLLLDQRDLKLQLQSSMGHSLNMWKVMTFSGSTTDMPYDPEALSLQLKETLLKMSVELPTAEFLFLAEAIFEGKENALIPLTVSLLENIQTQEAIALLQHHARAVGEPLMRTYCQLALLRLKKGSATPILNWIKAKKDTEMVRFRPSLPWEVSTGTQYHSLDLTPEENSRLLIECYQTFALEHTDKGIDLILEGIKTGTPHNRPILAGLLIAAIQ